MKCSLVSRKVQCTNSKGANNCNTHDYVPKNISYCVQKKALELKLRFFLLFCTVIFLLKNVLTAKNTLPDMILIMESTVWLYIQIHKH